MAMRAGTRFRSRPVDPSKRLHIHWGDSVDLEDDEDFRLSLLHSGMLDEEEDAVSAADLDSHAETEDAHNLREIDLSTLEIMVPRFVESSMYTINGSFRRPGQYIRAKAQAVDEFDDPTVTYDIEPEDDVFLEAMRAKGFRISEDVLERCIDRLEKETARLRQIKESKDVLAPPGCVDSAHLRPNEFQHIYEFWVRKRLKRGKALLRQFFEPPEMNDPNPKVAFRPRHKSFARSRRRNDVSSFRKLRDMRLQLARLQLILDLVKQRERRKDEEISHRYEVFHCKSNQLAQRIQLRKAHPTVDLALSGEEDVMVSYKEKAYMREREAHEAELYGRSHRRTKRRKRFDSSESEVSDQESVTTAMTNSYAAPSRKRRRLFSPTSSTSVTESDPLLPEQVLARVGRNGRCHLNARLACPANPIILRGLTNLVRHPAFPQGLPCTPAPLPAPAGTLGALYPSPTSLALAVLSHSLQIQTSLHSAVSSGSPPQLKRRDSNSTAAIMKPNPLLSQHHFIHSLCRAHHSPPLPSPAVQSTEN